MRYDGSPKIDFCLKISAIAVILQTETGRIYPLCCGGEAPDAFNQERQFPIEPFLLFSVYSIVHTLAYVKCFVEFF